MNTPFNPKQNWTNLVNAPFNHKDCTDLVNAPLHTERLQGSEDIFSLGVYGSVWGGIYISVQSLIKNNAH